MRVPPRLKLVIENVRDFERHVIHVAATGSNVELRRLVEKLRARAELRLVRAGVEGHPDDPGCATD